MSGILSNNHGEYLSDMTKVAPPVAVSGAALAGMSLQEWVLVLTALYTAIQIALTIFKAIKEHKK